ncbi:MULTISPECIES: hypothetical protein [Amylolactobacillus]|nr:MULTISPECIES: hypothetical protein [Amylolactobacillus]GED80478.1 hypothetical protein LAM01_09510 [Amylolactobacillus amylophilus]
MSQNTHTGISPKRRPVNVANVKARLEKTAETLDFLQGKTADKKSK